MREHGGRGTASAMDGSHIVTTDRGEEKRERGSIAGVYPQSLQDPRMGGSRLAKMADEEEELGTSGHEVEHPPMAGGAGEKGDDEESRVRRSLMSRSTSWN